MHCSPPEAAPVAAEEPLTLLVGNPNVGKSVLFGLLTGRYANVSNFPGTTVELMQGRRRDGEGAVIDLPGTNSLMPNAEDERVTRDVLMAHLERPGLNVVQVCDAKNLRRGLFLALQLAELEVPLVFVANMLDEAEARGFTLRADALSESLGVEVLEAVATQRQGVFPLLTGKAVFRRAVPSVSYEPAVERALAETAALLPEGLPGRRGVALMLLADEDSIPSWAGPWLNGREPELLALRAALARELREPVRLSLTRSRMAAAETIADGALERQQAPRRPWLERLGDWSLHPLYGLPVAAAVLYGLYLFVGVLGAGDAVDFLESTVFGEWITPWLDILLRPVLPEPLETFLVGPPGVAAGTGPGLLLGDYGLASMGLSYAFAIVLPIVGFFFIAFSVLEDSGYLPRLAVVLNRAFRTIGLNGKAVLPMILGLGCDTMATMTARILPSRKERVIVTLLLALGVPCSAQLGVVLGMLAALSPLAMSLWLGTVVGVLVLVGFLAARVLPGQSSDFVLEIPPMRLPRPGNIVVKTLARMEWYLKEVVPLFLLGTFVLWLLERVHVLGAIERATAPLVQQWLGLPARATDAFLIGFLRRDYGAAGLFDLFRGPLTSGTPSMEVEIQVVVSLVTITLFMPCIANLLMIVKERGWRTAVAMSAFIVPFAFGVGGALNWVLRGVLL